MRHRLAQLLSGLMLLAILIAFCFGMVSAFCIAVCITGTIAATFGAIPWTHIGMSVHDTLAMIGAGTVFAFVAVWLHVQILGLE